MDEPRLPPVVAGRSALPAFLAIEDWANAKTAAARAAAEAEVAAADAEAARIRREGEDALKQAVLAGEHEALRDVETQQRDKVSDARRAVEAWIRQAEEASTRAVTDALDVLLGADAQDVLLGADAQDVLLGADAQDVLLGADAQDVLLGADALDVADAGSADADSPDARESEEGD